MATKTFSLRKNTSALLVTKPSDYVAFKIFFPIVAKNFLIKQQEFQKNNFVVFWCIAVKLLIFYEAVHKAFFKCKMKVKSLEKNQACMRTCRLQSFVSSVCWLNYPVVSD